MPIGRFANFCLGRADTKEKEISDHTREGRGAKTFHKPAVFAPYLGWRALGLPCFSDIQAALS